MNLFIYVLHLELSLYQNNSVTYILYVILFLNSKASFVRERLWEKNIKKGIIVREFYDYG